MLQLRLCFFQKSEARSHLLIDGHSKADIRTILDHIVVAITQGKIEHLRRKAVQVTHTSAGMEASMTLPKASVTTAHMMVL